jgi:hypothetical protein
MNCVCGKGATCLELVHNVYSVIMTNCFKVYRRLSEPEKYCWVLPVCSDYCVFYVTLPNQVFHFMPPKLESSYLHLERPVMTSDDWLWLGSELVGFRRGNPRVGFYHTIPKPAYTVPVAGTGTHCTVNRAVSYETRSTTGTRRFLLIQLPFNLAKVVRTSIDMRRVFYEVVG